ncbi:MAG: hypothetical protein H6711_33245 [Myxococcales bacterium]|nr:hypothetical protein [Myxococcales bacterium]
MTTPTTFETVRLDPETVLVASPTRAWIRRDARTLGAREVSGGGGIELARSLLDGAVAAAFRHARPEAVPPMSATRWVYRLAGLYHLTHSTPGLLIDAAARFEAAGRSALAGWARTRAREETHHDLLALRDLRDLGLDGEAVVAALRPSTAIRLVDYFERSVDAADPIGCVGYAYALERLAMTVREPEIRAIEALLPAGTRATRCLRVHSATGSDADHVADTLVVVAALSPAERAAIAVAAHEAARLCFEPDPEGAPSDAAIAAVLAACARPTNSST